MALSIKFIIALQQIPGYGPRRAIALSELAREEEIGSAEELFRFARGCVQDKKLPGACLRSIEDFKEASASAQRILEESGRLGIGAVSYQDPLFPEKLLSTINEEGKKSVPAVLYYKGDISAVRRKGAAVIGTRHPTPEGALAGEYYGELLAGEGFNIIGGLAAGCDTAAHNGALKARAGATTAFLAHGLDTVYPKENASLAREIVARGGLLMSEYPVGTAANPGNFVARDRLQAALADVVIVVQTEIGGGTMHAANAALKAGKPLFCVQFPKLGSDEKTLGNAYLAGKGAEWLRSSTALSQIRETLCGRGPANP